MCGWKGVCVCVICPRINTSSCIHAYTNSFNQSPNIYVISTYMLGAADSAAHKTKEGSWPSELVWLFVEHSLAPCKTVTPHLLPTHRFSSASNFILLPQSASCTYSQVCRRPIFIRFWISKERRGQWPCNHNLILSFLGSDSIVSSFLEP